MTAPVRPARPRTVVGVATAGAAIGLLLAATLGVRRIAAQPIIGPPLPSLAGRPQTAAGRQARAAVRDFEHSRQRFLPTDPGGYQPDRCDVRIGRLCYWDNNGDTLVPPELPAALRARTVLLAQLDQAAAADSADDWIVGQRVRYLLELGRTADAAGAAAGCRGTPWWCQALAALALHAAADHRAAAAAHDSARVLLPDAAARCAWDDVALWLPSDAARAYRRLPCGSADRVRYEARFWRLAQPFWALPANDLRTELGARRTLAHLHAAAPNPQVMAWGDDLAESDVRYGVPVAWTVRRPPFGSTVEASVVGYEPTPSYDFTPDARTLAPATLLTRPVPAAVSGAGTWTLRRPLAQTRYAPRYAALGVSALDHQIARFRRGDTLVVVGAYATVDSGPAAPGTPARRTAALVLDDTAARPAAVRRRDDAPPAGALLATVLAPASGADAGTPGWLASLEVLDTAAVPDSTRSGGDGPSGRRWRPPGGPQRGRAARARLPLAPLPPDATISDLLLVRPGDYGPAPTLAAVVDSAVGAPVVRAGQLFGLYWEQYRRATTPPTVAITATRVGTSAWERLGALVGRTVVTQPVSLRYVDPVGRSASPGRYVALRWPVVPPGTYRLAVTVAAAPERAVASGPPDSIPAGTVPAGTVPADTASSAPAALPVGTSVVVRVVR